MWNDFRCLCIRLVCYCTAAKFGLKQGLNFRMAESPSSAKRTLVWVWTPVIQMWPLYQRLTNWHGYVWYIQSEQWCHCWMLTVMILKYTYQHTRSLHLQQYSTQLHVMQTHTHTHPFNGPFSGTTQVSRYQKGKTNLDFTKARDSEWQWHQLGHMQICT